MSTLHDKLKEICSWSLANTPGGYPTQIGPDVASTFRVDAGHSGATIVEAVVKTGGISEIHNEVRHVQLLGQDICPRVYGEWPGGYAMERLRRGGFDGSLDIILTVARDHLNKLVWCREVVEDTPQWIYEFYERFHHTVPDFAREEKPCLIHGDPTLGNIVLLPGHYLKILDPKPPGRGIPSFRSVDLGKMLQSMLGWEQMVTLRRSLPLVSPLSDLEDQDLLRVVFWCSVHLRRIMQREDKESPVWLWAHERRQKLIYEVLP